MKRFCNLIVFFLSSIFSVYLQFIAVEKDRQQNGYCGQIAVIQGCRKLFHSPLPLDPPALY